jgi:ribosome-binding protein aMBF1 (putative translation factor)
MMVNIICNIQTHIEELWPIVFDHLSLLLESSQRYSTLLIERAVVSVMRICVVLVAKPNHLRDQIYLSFDLLGGLPPAVANSVAEKIVSGLVIVVKNHHEVISSQTEWNTVLALVRSSVSNLEAARVSFDLIQQLTAEGPEQCISVDNVAGLVAVLDDFITAAGIVAEEDQRTGCSQPGSSSSSIIDRGKRAVDLLYEILEWGEVEDAHDMSRHRPTLSVLDSLSHHATSASPDVRDSVLSFLSRALHGPLAVPPADVTEIFWRALYAVLEALIAAPSDTEMTESCLRASALLCRAFMWFEMLNDDMTVQDIAERWMQVLDYLERLMHVDRSDQLLEAVSESLEDVIFAMQSTGILVPPTVDEHSDSGDEPSQLLWQITQDMTEHLMPGFMESIIPLPPVTAVRSTWSPTIAATSAEWKNSMSVWREKAPVAKVTRNAAALNAARRADTVVATEKKISRPNKAHPRGYLAVLFFRPLISHPLLGTDYQRIAKLDRENEVAPPAKVAPSVGRAIQTARMELQFSQKDVAQKISEKLSVLQDYESGKAIPNSQILAKLERVLGVKLRGSDIGKKLEGSKKP